MSWVRVRKDMPCPICGRPDWCFVASDGDAALCQRVESRIRRGEAGYFHRLTQTLSVVKRSVKIKSDIVCVAEIPILAEQYRQAMTAERYRLLSAALGVSVESLKRLMCGWDGEAYTFPMFDWAGCVIGIRRRFPNGRKICVIGSRNGVFLPNGLRGDGTLLIVEGNSDAAAGLDLGFDTLGRPSCSGGADLIKRFIRKNPYPRIVVCPDNDTKADGTNPGKSGGLRLAAMLRLYCPDVRIVMPPAKYNDLRGWIAAGLTRAELIENIKNTSPLKLEVKSSAS